MHRIIRSSKLHLGRSLRLTEQRQDPRNVFDTQKLRIVEAMPSFPTGPFVPWLAGNAISVLGVNGIYNYQNWSKRFKRKPFALIVAAETLVVLPAAEDAR